MTQRFFQAWLLNLFSMVFACSLFAATPVISSVTGTVSTGRTLTISGTTLMDENKTNWFSPFKTGTAYGFEGASYTADGYDIAPDEMTHGTRGYDTNVKLSGNKSIYGRVTVSEKTGAGFGVELPSTQTDIYTRFYTRWHSAGSWKWPTSYIKMHLPLGNYGDACYFQPDYSSGSTLPTHMFAKYSNSTQSLDVSSTFMEDNRWYCMEIRNKTSTTTNFTGWVDGVQVLNVNNHTGVGATQRVLFGLINMCCQGSGFDLTEWIDNLAVSSSRVYCSSIVEIGNNSDYASATKIYQAPTSLSDTSITVTVDLSGLGAGPYYLWVTNNRQERSAVYTLSGGGEVGPSAPAGLRLVN